VRNQNALIVRILHGATSATSNSATIANLPSSVERVAWNIVMIAIAIGYLAIDATRPFVLTAKICSCVRGATSLSATTARIS
jgi:hypothetical protein